ncbi:MAG: oligosaccharide flippase family protein [Candidatus Hodarchaeota archaeon]
MLAQKLILEYSTQISIQLIRIAASIVVARIAGPTVLGTVAFGLAYVSMFIFISDLGLGTAHIKLVSEGKDLGKCISTYTVLRSVTTSFFFILVLGIFLFQKYVFYADFESTTHEYVIFIMLFAVTIQQFLTIPKTTFAARTEQVKKDIPDFARNFTYQVLRIIIVLLGFRAIALAIGNLVSTLLIIPVIFYLFKDYPHSGFDKSLAKRYLKISLPIILIGMSTSVISYLDKILLQFFTNSEQVGYYTAGYRIGGFVLLIANSVSMLFFPLFSKAVANKDFEYIKNKINKFERFSFLFIMPAVILLAIYSDTIVKLVLGPQYIPSINIMLIITVAMFLMVLNIPYGNVITGMGFFRLAAIINFLNFGFFVFVLVLLTYPKLLNLEATGAAITVLLSNLFIGILYRVFAKKKCQILRMKKGLMFFSYGILNFFVFNYLYHSLNILGDIKIKILFVFVYLVITYFSFYLLRWIKKEDWATLFEIVDIKSMSKYIKGEIRNNTL